MPAKNTTLKTGDRLNLVDKKLWKEYCEQTGSDISYKDFKLIITESNSLIKSKTLSNASGFKLSESMGYLAIKRYKPKSGTRSIDFQKSKLAGVRVYHTNFHSHGYKGRIMWLTANVSNCKYINLYKFIPERDFQRGMAKNIKEGKVYNEFGYDHFKTKKIKLNFNRL